MNSPMLALQLLLTLAASFLIGLELEGRKASGKAFSPGGVRTMPLVSLAGFLLAVLGGDQLYAFVVGLAILGVWLAMLYRAKMLHGNFGMTTEAYVLLVYVLGGLVAVQAWWLVAALTVLMVLLQELKQPLEGLIQRLSEDELITIAKFVLLSGVILPLLPEGPEQYTGLQFRPRQIWWVVVAVSGLSYVAYQLQRFLGRTRQAVLVTGLLGGAYSSTVTAVVLSRRSREQSAGGDRQLAGAILAASGVMNLRLLVLLALFWPGLAAAAAWPLLAAAVVGTAAGGLICLWPGRDGDGQAPVDLRKAGSPLELRTAFAFAAILVAVLAVTQLADRWLGGRGLLAVAGLSGLGVIDPFVLSLTQIRSASLGPLVLAVIVAASANNLAKGVYAVALGRRRMGMMSLLLLIALAVATMCGWAALVATGFTPPPQ